MEHKKILIVDDEQDILDALNRLLEEEPYTVLTANNINKGLEILADHKDVPISLVISDQKMPNTTGTEFLSEVERLYPEATCAILTGFNDLQTIKNHSNVYKVLTKPWGDTEIQDFIKEVFDC